MRISDWSSDVCSSDLVEDVLRAALPADRRSRFPTLVHRNGSSHRDAKELSQVNFPEHIGCVGHPPAFAAHEDRLMGRQVEEPEGPRSEEHKSDLQSLMRIPYAVFCSNKKTKQNN